MQDPWASLRKLRIGCVKYLNSRPLIYSYDGPVVFDHPSSLALHLANGNLDAALVPAFHAFVNSDYSLVDGVAIACDGPVYSVVLAYKGELKDLEKIEPDPASLSSAHLLKVLLKEFHGMEPEYAKEADAKLIIGNQAIEDRMANKDNAAVKYLDLGEEWKLRTGLPFVFALWVLRPGLKDLQGIGDAFRKLKESGVARIPEIVAADGAFNAEFREKYLTNNIHFDLGEAEKAALEKYRELLAKHSMIGRGRFPLRFI